jgi:hypothetical protein
VLEKFIKYCDNYPDQVIRDNEEDNRNGYLDERVIEIMYEWKGIKDIIPIKEDADWRQALVNAYENYRKLQLIQILPYLYSDYFMRLQNDFGFDWQENERTYLSELSNNVKKDVLRGRELNGEPANIDF